jgi:hypothetical protein
MRAAPLGGAEDVPRVSVVVLRAPRRTPVGRRGALARAGTSAASHAARIT